MVEDMHFGDVLRAGLVLLAAVGQIATGYYPTFRRGNEIRSDEQATSITPSDYAFVVIWPLIYLGGLALAVFQALPSQISAPLPQAIGWPLFIVFVANCLWVVYVTLRRIDWISQAIIASALLFALVGLYGLGPDRAVEGRDFWLLRAPIEITAGWINAAAFVNLASVLRKDGREVGNGAAIAIIVAATGIACLVIGTLGGWVYAGAFAWALIAIAVASLRSDNRAVATTAVLAIPITMLPLLSF